MKEQQSIVGIVALNQNYPQGWDDCLYILMNRLPSGGVSCHSNLLLEVMVGLWQKRERESYVSKRHCFIFCLFDRKCLGRI